MNANNEMENDDIETLQYVKPRAKGLRALLPEERTVAERAKEAYYRYAPRVKKAAKKAITAARKYSQERKKRHPQRTQERRLPSLGTLLRSQGGKGTGPLTGTLGEQVRHFGKGTKEKDIEKC